MPIADVTLALTVQLNPAASVPPVIAIVVPAIARVAPAQVVAAADGVAKISPAGEAGNVSETAMPVRVCAVFGLVIVIVNVDVPPTATAVGAKALLTAGARSTTVVAVAGALSLVDSVVSMIVAPIRAVAVLVYVPGVAGKSA